MTAEVLKIELEAESCCVCGNNDTELLTPEEHDAEAPVGQMPLRAMLLQLSNTKVVPEGRLCSSCVRRTQEAYEFTSSLSSRGVLPLSEKIRALRRRLHELTQKIDVFIVVGGLGGNAGNSYSEEDIIMVDKSALAAAAKADDEELERARNARGDTVYQCTVCPASFQRVSEYREHSAAHGSDAPHCCWTCGAQFATRCALRDHAAHHSAAPALHCYICDTSFQSEGAMRRHEAGCEARCGACGAQCADRAALSRHASAAHGAHCAPPHLCPVCYRVYADAELLAAHLLRHRQAKQFVCGYDCCILRFADRKALMSHIRKSHGADLPAPEEAEPEDADPRPAPAPSTACEHCPRTFGSAAALKRHARVHRAPRTPHTAHSAPAQEEGNEFQHEDQMELEGEVEYLEVEELEYLEDRDDNYEQKPNIADL